jgi:hypothetical protein
MYCNRIFLQQLFSQDGRRKKDCSSCSFEYATRVVLQCIPTTCFKQFLRKKKEKANYNSYTSAVQNTPLTLYVVPGPWY